MAVFVARFMLLVSFCIVVHLDALQPPVCNDSDIFVSQKDADDRLQSTCPPTKDCKLELVKHKIKKNLQSDNGKWEFDEVSTCYLCTPTCCSNMTIFTRFRRNACDEFLSHYKFEKQTINVWSRYDREVLTYIVSKDLEKHGVYLYLPREEGMRLCAYRVYDNKYLTINCGRRSIPRTNFKGAVCAEEETSTGVECAKAQKIGL